MSQDPIKENESQDDHWLKLKKPSPKSRKEKALVGSKISDSVMEGVVQFFQLISSSLRAAGQSVPYVGGAIMLLALIPRSLANILDNKKPLPERVISGVFISVVLGLVITGMVLGGTVALIGGAVVTASMALVKGFDFIRAFLQKSKINKLISLREKFEQGISNKEMFKNTDEFNELIAIAYVKSQNEKAQGKEEIEKAEHIKKLMELKQISLDSLAKDHVARKLQEKYEQHNKLLESLDSEIKKLFETEGEKEREPIQNSIYTLKAQLYTSQLEIEDLTKSSEELKKERSMLNKGLILSSTMFGISAAATVLTLFSVLLLLGAIAAPPIAIPLIIGLSIAVAATGIFQFVAEKFVGYDNKRKSDQKRTNIEDNILKEAKERYEQSMDKSSDESIQMPMEGNDARPYLTNPNLPDSSEEETKPPPISPNKNTSESFETTKSRVHILQIPIEQREENVVAVLNLLESEQLNARENYPIQNMIKLIQETDTKNSEVILVNLSKIKELINEITPELRSQMSSPVNKILEVFTKKEATNFRVIREKLEEIVEPEFNFKEIMNYTEPDLHKTYF